MLKTKNELKNLREKIYKKQKTFMEIMYKNNLDYDDISIKKNKDEIFILEFVYDMKKDLYDYDYEVFWNVKKIK